VDSHSSPRRQCTRRDILKSVALASLPLAFPLSGFAGQAQQPMTANGGTDPFPIPWLDKNGSRNQPGMPNNEPSHIYHFKGGVARSSAFTGMGTIIAAIVLPLALRRPITA
jgi:hypothetical protein